MFSRKPFEPGSRRAAPQAKRQPTPPQPRRAPFGLPMPFPLGDKARRERDLPLGDDSLLDDSPLPLPLGGGGRGEGRVSPHGGSGRPENRAPGPAPRQAIPRELSELEWARERLQFSDDLVAADRAATVAPTAEPVSPLAVDRATVDPSVPAPTAAPPIPFNRVVAGPALAADHDTADEIEAEPDPAPVPPFLARLMSASAPLTPPPTSTVPCAEEGGTTGIDSVIVQDGGEAADGSPSPTPTALRQPAIDHDAPTPPPASRAPVSPPPPPLVQRLERLAPPTARRNGPAAAQKAPTSKLASTSAASDDPLVAPDRPGADILDFSDPVPDELLTASPAIVEPALTTTPPRTQSRKRRTDGPGQIEPLPPALSSMWRLCTLGYQHEPQLMAVSFALALMAALPDALIAFWLKLLGEGVERLNIPLILVAAFALAFSSAGTWLIRTVSTRVQRTFRDKVTIALEAHVARLQASIVTVAHQERPEYLDRLSVLRDQVFVLDHMYMSLFSTCGWILRLSVTVVLLMSVHPVLILLALCALPPVLSATWRPGVERAAQESGAQAKRLARHLFTVATTAPAGKEVRVTGIGQKLIADRRAAWDRWYGPVSDARWTSAVFHTLGWLVFGGAYVGAVVFVAAGLHASAAHVLVVLVAGARLSAYVGATVGEIGFLRGIWMDGSRRLAWLEEYAASQETQDDLPVPLNLNEGIRFDRVSFAYPGTDRLVLNDVSLSLPAGAVVAIVGENGAGKSTLVKLLGKLYEPSSGEITVDGRPLSRMAADEWRTSLAGAQQDFYRFELPARQSIGMGDLPRLDDDRAVRTAVERAGAEDVLLKLPDGLDTQLGKTWPGGVDLSFGQWQKLALARGFMRDHPLLLVLDEPTAALDAETEHALFERYAAAARGQSPNGAGHAPVPNGRPANGRITVLVSHRFSTVRMADLIVVLDGARVAEVGSHDELIAKGGQYAELYNLQAAAYR